MWQGLHTELASSGFVVIAIALDAGGTPAVTPWIRPGDLEAQYPQPFRDLMGWTAADWKCAAAPTYPCLLDETFLLTRLYGITNVPTAVWIDEDGRIVRPPEPAGAGDFFRQVNLETFALPDDALNEARHVRSLYFGAIRDWVRNGPASRFVIPADNQAGAIPIAAPDDRLADAAFRLGTILQKRGATGSAQGFFSQATSIRWRAFAYHRQARVLAAPETIGELDAGPGMWEQLAALGDEPFYDPIRMEGIGSA